MRTLGRSIWFIGLAISLWVTLGIASLIYDLWGIVVLIAAIFLFPVAWVITPLYSGFWLGEWGLLQWELIGTVLVMTGFYMSSAYSKNGG